jgi:hypothetical protein
MKFHVFSLIVGLCAIGVRAGEQVYAIPLNNEVPVYGNELKRLYEKPLFFVSSSQRLLVIESGKNSIKIQDSTENKGWIEKRLVSLGKKKAAFQFEPVTIEEWLGLPELISINDGQEQVQNRLVIDRSFADALRDNVDKETIMRQAGQ